MRRSLSILCMVLVLAQPAWSESEDQNEDEAELGLEEGVELGVEDKIRSITLAAHFETIGFPFTFHRGLSAEYLPNDHWSLGLAFSEASLGLGTFGVDVASVKETLKVFEARYFIGTSSFHIPFGFGQREIRAQLGNEYLSKISGNASHLDVLMIRQNLLHAGLANRWYADGGFTVGVDWLQLYVPVGDAAIEAPYLRSSAGEERKNDVEKILRIFEYIPHISMLRLHAGYSF